MYLLSEEIYVAQPQGFEQLGSEDKFYRLNNALYGLEHSARAWYIFFHFFLVSLGSKSSFAAPRFFFKRSGTKITLLLVSVDDIWFSWKNQNQIRITLDSICTRFTAMLSDGCLKFLVIFVETGMGITKLHHCPLTARILFYFGMDGCAPAKVPLPLGTDLNISRNVREGNSEDVEKTPCLQLVVCLLHLSNRTRPRISYAVGYLSRFMQNPTIALWKKHVLR